MCPSQVYMWFLSKSFGKIINQKITMSAVPQAAFMVKKFRETEQKHSQEQIPFSHERVELNPLKYNSKLMNSIWGLYNQYSVHNLKNNLDKTMCVDATVNQQIKAVGAASSGPKASVPFWNPMDKIQSVLGYQH